MKINVKAYPLLHAVPIVVVGSKSDDRMDFTTVGDVAVISLIPAMMMISLHQDHYITELINESGKYSINVPTPELLDEVDACGMKSGRAFDKSQLFTTTVDEDGYIAIEEAPVTLYCEVFEKVQVEHRVLFLARVVKSFIEEDYVIDPECEGSLDLTGFQTISYGMDNHYYAGGGEPIGTGYQEGESIIESLEDESEFNIID
ncbi:MULTISPECIES: flavin reductase family protein [unclassified Fusibacter]|uniref:flavin reductase family protein n=1 Tax=unclassified Fusibacter TaxID=2624464 RepID=UPI001012E205|nr:MULTISPECIES: flavin reductase family protein [unclassified Fusibacter]MCK8060004.1 flavin reductase family protein [Fusibacter sp. A2]NPE22144.1 flavin reductase family protein [Fusibacter sp. A1]RXV60922.1 flavin reductase family protein [Fusibacter sp. A1]